MSAALLPAKRLRELEAELEVISKTVEICLVIRNKDTGEEWQIGGVWDNVRRMYVDDLPEGAKSRRVFEFYDKQFIYLLDILRLYHENKTAEIPVHDVVLTAGRRAGKSTISAGVAVILCVMFPGLAIKIIGKRKKHGRKIIEMIRRVMKSDAVHYDKETVSLRFANHSFIETAAADLAGNYDIGDKYHILIFDEGAAMKGEVYDYMAPSTTDWNGLNIIPTTQRGISWVFEKIRQSKDPDPLKSSVVKVYELSTLENTFLSSGALRRLESMKYTLSARAYASEVLGQAIPDGGLAVPDFGPENICLPGVLEEGDNGTGALSTYLWCIVPKDGPPRARAEWMRKKAWIGIDFNQSTPNVGVVVQFNEIGAPLIVGEYELMGSTDQFGVGLQTYLSSTFGWGVEDVVLVADSSGQWQNPSGKKGAYKNPSYDVLRAQHWFVTTPNAGGKRANPLRWQRLEVLRTLVCTGMGARHLQITQNCPRLIRALEELDMDARRHIANLESQHTHIYDALTYPLYRLWGTYAGIRHYRQALVTLMDEGDGRKHDNDDI